MEYDDKKKLSVTCLLSEYVFSNLKLDVNYSIARVMLEKIGDINDISIEEVAYRAHTSPGSVTKFCKKLGYANFKELKADKYQYAYADVFHDMIHISGTRGIDSAMNFFVEENKKKMLEIINGFDHEQIKRISRRLQEVKSGAIFSGLHGFASANFFTELATYYGIGLYEINRTSEISMLKTVLDSERLVFVISLTGKWMDNYIEALEITPEISEKIILISYNNTEKYRNYCSEIVSLSNVHEFYLSNYFSSTTLSMLFLLIIVYFNEIVE